MIFGLVTYLIGKWKVGKSINAGILQQTMFDFQPDLIIKKVGKHQERRGSMETGQESMYETQKASGKLT